MSEGAKGVESFHAQAAVVEQDRQSREDGDIQCASGDGRNFRDAFKRTRCLIPVSGYCEWQNTPDGKQPWYFTARDGSLALTTAGLWDEWRDRGTGEKLQSCTMLITEPHSFVAEVHDRMPALLAEKDYDAWLSGSASVELLRPAPEDLLQRWPVSKRVNSSKAPADDATLIDRIIP